MIDLHVHSNRSDGSLTPTEVVALAASKQLTSFALTDHDTIDGLAEAKAAGTALGIEVIDGIEFSTEYLGRDIHIVGLFIENTSLAFQKHLQNFVDARIWRNQKMCRNLQKAGIDISYEKLVSAYPDSVITRGHYSRYLFENGYVKSLPEAFDRYLGDHTKYFVPREKVTPAQAVELILSAKGIPILAHPTLYRMGHDTLHTLIRTLKDTGLVGMEVFYSTHTPAEEREMAKIARQYELLPSGGSDFHGKSKPKLEIGTGYGSLHVCDWVLDDLKAKRKELFNA